MILGAARGWYWVSLIEVWRGDEAQHYSYVQQLASGRGPPIVGVDRISDEAAALYKQSATNGFRPTDATSDPMDPRYGPSFQQYEGGQGPVYYAVLSVPFRLAKNLGTSDRLLMLRLVSMLILLSSVPLTWLLARITFPWMPQVWIAAPALLILFQAFNFNGSGLSNDALVTPLGLLALIGVVWVRRSGFRLRLAIATGGSFGLALVTKATALAIVPALLTGFVAAVVRQRPSWSRTLGWAALASLAAAMPVMPWLLWLKQAYPRSSATTQFNRILGGIIGRYSWGRGTLFRYLGSVTSSLFNAEPRPSYEPYSMILLGAAAASAAAGIAAALRRRDGDCTFALGWLALAAPLGFAVMAWFVAMVLDGYGVVQGRYLGPLTPALALLIAAGAFTVLRPRFALFTLTLLATVMLTMEIGLDISYVGTYYLRSLPVPGSAPVIVQDFGDAYVLGMTVEVMSRCPATLIGFAFKGAGQELTNRPVSVAVTTGEGVVSAPRIATEPLSGASMSFYRLDRLKGSFQISVGGPAVAISTQERVAEVGLVGTRGDPVALLYCPSRDPASVRFAQLHHPQHPDLPLSFVTGWPVGWALATRVLLVFSLVFALSGSWKGVVQRAARSESGGASPPGSS